MVSNDEIVRIESLNLFGIDDSYENKLRSRLKKNENDSHVWYQLGSHLRTLRKDSEAEQALLIAVLLKPNNERAWYELALLYEFSGDKHNANLAWDAIDLIVLGLDTSQLLGGIIRDVNKD